MFSFRAKVTVLAIATVCITLLCSSLYVQYVMAGRLGRKVGKGVYEYDENGNRIVK